MATLECNLFERFSVIDSETPDCKSRRINRGEQADMNGRKYFLASGLAIALIFMSVASLPAAPQGNPSGARRGLRFLQLMGAGQFVGGLNLTDAQKTQIKGILTANKTQMIQAAYDVVKARLDMENGVANAATELANAQVKASSLKKQIFEQIKPILTPDQLAKVQARQQQRSQRLQNLLDRLHSKMSA